MEKLLQELYQLDPGLKTHESILKQVLSELLMAKPDATMDPAFYQKLKTMLQVRMKKRMGDKKSLTIFPFSFWKNSTYAFSGVVAITLVVAGILTQSSSNTFKIVPLEEGAFGSLISPTTDSQGERGGLGISSDDTVQNIYDSSFWLPEERINYEFTYVGDPLTLTDTAVEVLHRILPEAPKQTLSSDVMNMNSFGDYRPTYVNLNPTGSEGYAITYDYMYGQISLWEYIKSSTECPWGQCSDWDTSSLSVDNVPIEQTIATANQFLQDHGISTENLGNPYIFDSENFRNYGEIGYILEVIYPYEINGQTVDYVWGNASGMMVAVDVHRNKVTNLSGLFTSNQFESSAYQAATVDEILVAAKTGGENNYLWEDPTETQEFQLGTPTLIYAIVSQYNNNDGISTDLYVPAYSFPILNDTENLYWPETVIIPLAKDLITQPEPQPILFEGVEGQPVAQ